MLGAGMSGHPLKKCQYERNSAVTGGVRTRAVILHPSLYSAPTNSVSFLHSLRIRPMPFTSASVVRIALIAGIASLSSLPALAQRGGGDPGGFMSRYDRNGNGMLDPDEQEGRMRSMVERMQSADPSIKPGQPIPLTKITEAFERMQGEGGRGGSWGGRGGDDRGRGGDDRGRGGDDRGRGGDDRGRGGERGGETIDPMAVAPLVPGFGMEIPVLPMLGFGPSADILAVVPSEADLKEARNNIQRHDRNRDGQLDTEEVKRAGFWGNPMDFDRNGDGKLSENELATREAVERKGNEARGRESRQSPQAPEEQTEKAELVDFQGRRSYRVYSATAPEGLPRFFTDRDLNKDGQVSMSEYTSDWSEKTVAEFYGWDSNHDGVITATEVLKGVISGLTASETRSGSAPQGNGAPAMSTEFTSPSSSTRESRGPAASPDAPAAKLQMPSDPPSEKVIGIAKKTIERHDKNADFELTPDEWSKMLISPADADFNGDGRITVHEYAGYLIAKQERLK